MVPCSLPEHARHILQEAGERRGRVGPAAQPAAYSQAVSPAEGRGSWREGRLSCGVVSAQGMPLFLICIKVSCGWGSVPSTGMEPRGVRNVDFADKLSIPCGLSLYLNFSPFVFSLKFSNGQTLPIAQYFRGTCVLQNAWHRRKMFPNAWLQQDIGVALSISILILSIIIFDTKASMGKMKAGHCYQFGEPLKGSPHVWGTFSQVKDTFLNSLPWRTLIFNYQLDEDARKRLYFFIQPQFLCNIGFFRWLSLVPNSSVVWPKCTDECLVQKANSECDMMAVGWEPGGSDGGVTGRLRGLGHIPYVPWFFKLDRLFWSLSASWRLAMLLAYQRPREVLP